MYSAATDDELRDWLCFADQHGPSFLQRIVEAAFTADLKNYALLRPLLLELKKEWPRPA